MVTPPESYLGSFVCFSGAVEDRFVIDSGTTSHMVKDVQLLDDYEMLPQPLLVEVGDKNRILAIATGRVGVLRNVLYVPKFARNLISVKQLAKVGYKIVFSGESVSLEDGVGHSMIIGGLFSNLYILNETLYSHNSNRPIA